MFEQANLFVELAHPALDNLVDHLFRLALLQGAGALDLLFVLQRFLADIFLANELRIGRRNMHSDIVDQLLKVIGSRNEIGFAVHLHQHAEFAAGVNIGADGTLVRRAGRLLLGDRYAPLSQDELSLREVALGFFQGRLAIHDSRSAALAKLFDHFRGDFRHSISLRSFSARRR